MESSSSHFEGSAAPVPEAAGLGKRVGALLVDGIVVLLPLYVVATLLFGDTETSDEGFSFSLTGLPFVLTTLITLGYFFLLEDRNQGQTLGKRLVGIRVVSDDGSGQPSSTSIFLRTLLRIVDGIFFYAVGFIVALISSKNQRLGDMTGSTRVVDA